MTSTGSDGFRGVFEGSITGSHFEVTRRPYHKNCTCALHNKTRSSPSSSSSSSCPHHKPSKVSYPIKRSWSEGSFSLYPAPATPNNNPSPSSSSSSSSSSSDLLSKGTHHHPPLIPRASSSSNFDFFISNSDV